MGILNMTPDSFYAGSRYGQLSEALREAEQMLTEGATFIDVGGHSTRPGATDVPLEEELERVLPVIKAIRKSLPEALISIDTFRAPVALAAVDSGAHIINDVSGGTLDADMFSTVARLKVPYILMHLRGTPQSMATLTQYEHLVKEMIDYFHEKLHQLTELKVADVLIDPGFGFAKNIKQNFELLSSLSAFRILGKPLLVGLSRKSMVWKTLNLKPEEALNGTTVLNTVALMQGASILRVHDVKPAIEAIKLLANIRIGNSFDNFKV